MLPTKNISSSLDEIIWELEKSINYYDYYAKGNLNKNRTMKTIIFQYGYITGFLESCEKYKIDIDLKYYNHKMFELRNKELKRFLD